MKKLVLLTVAASTTFLLTGCPDKEPVHVVHETRVIHTHRSSDQVNVPQNGNSDNFEAVERPSTYSR